nr:hypothetical protein [Bacillota bacterium]
MLVFKQITGTAVPGRSTLKRPCRTGKGSGGKRDRGGSEKNADRKRRRLLPAVLSEGPSSAKFKGGYTGKKQAADFSEMSFFRGTGGVVAAPADFGP